MKCLRVLIVSAVIAFTIGGCVPIKRITFSGDEAKGRATMQGEINRQSAMADAMRRPGGMTRLDLAQPPGSYMMLRQVGNVQNIHVDTPIIPASVIAVKSPVRVLAQPEEKTKKTNGTDSDLYTLTQKNNGYGGEGGIQFAMRRISKSNGRIIWEWTATPGSHSIDKASYVSSVAINKNAVYFSFVYNSIVGSDQHSEIFIQARRKNKGELLWQYHVSFAAWIEPHPQIIADANNLYCVESAEDGSVIFASLDAHTGSQAWLTPLALQSYQASQLAIVGSSVYIASMRGSFADGTLLKRFDKKSGAETGSTTGENLGLSDSAHANAVDKVYGITSMQGGHGQLYIAAVDKYNFYDSFQHHELRWHQIDPQSLAIKNTSGSVSSLVFPDSIPSVVGTWVAASGGFVYLTYTTKNASFHAYTQKFKKNGTLVSTREIDYSGMLAATSLSVYDAPGDYFGKLKAGDINTFQWQISIPPDEYENEIRMAADEDTAGQTTIVKVSI